MRLRLLTFTLIAAVAAGTQQPDGALAADPPTCRPATVVTVPLAPVNVTTDCDDAGVNPTVTVVAKPIGGTLTDFPGQYVPSAAFHGVDHLFYTVKNTATGLTSPQTVINLVVNSALKCADGTATTQAGTPLKLTFPCTDADTDSVLIRAEDPEHGSVDPETGHEITYAPDPGFVGTDVITFVGIDGAFVTAEHTLTITVTAPPAAVVAPTVTATAPLTPIPGPKPTSAPDKTAPTVTVKATTARIDKGLALTLNANEAGTAKLTLTAGKNTAKKSVTLAKGTNKVTIKLSAKALKHTKRVKATLTIVATDAAGNRTTQKLSLILKR